MKFRGNDGTWLWTITKGGTASDRGRALWLSSQIFLRVDTKSTLYGSEVSNSTWDVALIKYNLAGNEISGAQVGGASEIYGYDLKPAFAGGWFAAAHPNRRQSQACCPSHGSTASSLRAAALATCLGLQFLALATDGCVFLRSDEPSLWARLPAPPPSTGHGPPAFKMALAACKAPFAREDRMVQWASAATSALSLWCTDLGEGLLPELVEWMGWSDTDSEAQTDRKMISTPPSGELYGLSKMMNLKPTRKPWGPSPTLRVEEQTLEGQMESEINNVGEWRSDANVIQEQQKEKCTKGTFRRRIFEAARRTREASVKKVFGVLCVDDGLTQADLVEVDMDGTDLTRHRVVCRGITRERLRSDHLDEEALASIRASLFRLCQGQRPLAGLTVDLGYLWMKHQRALRQLVPHWLVLTTPLVQLPLIRTCFRTVDATLLVVWEDASVSELSWLEASSNIRIDGQVEVLLVRASQAEQAEWSSFLSKGKSDLKDQAPMAPLLLDLLDRVQIRLAELSRKDVAVSSILVDGSLSRFSKGLRNATQLPVFDEVSMMGLFSAASSLSDFSEASVLGRLEDKMQRIGNGQNSVRDRVTEGQLGLVQLDSYEYVRAVGDADHESTFSFQTNPRVAQGLSFEKAQTAAQEPVMLESLRQAAKEMETAHCFGIAGNCGFMQFYQASVREAVSVPVFLSALVQVPTMAAALDSRDRILVLTANETSFREAQELLLRAECCNMALDQIVVRGCEDVPGFEAVAKMEQVDTQKVENSLSQFVEEILAEGDGAFIKMIVLECTELPHYAARLRRVSGLPVLDLVTCANFFAKVLVGSFSLAGDYPHHSSSNS
eukprot:s719_g9.t2